MSARPELEPLWEALKDVGHAYSASSEVEEVFESAGRWVRAALGTEYVAARIDLPNAGGRLRVIWADGDASDYVGRKRSARRRTVFGSKSFVLVDLPPSEGRALALLPLISRGASIGVLEVVAPRSAVESRFESLQAVASQVAMVISHMSEQARLRHEVESLEAAANLGRDLVKARSPKAAVRTVVCFISDRFNVPVAAWLPNGHPRELVLSEVRGAGTRKRKELRGELGILRDWRSVSAAERTEVVRRFGEIMRVPDIEVVHAGSALLLAARQTPSPRVSLESIGSLLEEALRHLTMAAQAKRRNQQLDLGIAWTAHEFRGPVLGVKAVLEFLMRGEGGSERSQVMLRRSTRELGQLADLTDGLLRWGVGAERLSRRRVNLMRVVDDAVGSSCLEAGDDRVLVSGPHSAIAWVDPKTLRVAIANLVRNALAYSPPGSPVVVAAHASGDTATICVRDRGPGVPPAEREMIFDPFARGHTGPRSRAGNGLGLFIARRIVEAHGGVIELKAGGGGATFCIRLPRDAGGLQPSGS